MNVNHIADVRDQPWSIPLWKGDRNWQVTKTDVTENCAAINLISFSYSFLCLSLKLNFSIPILCVAQIILQWKNKNLLKWPSQTRLWKGYMTSSKETVSVKRIQVVDCIQSCLSRHGLLIIWRKNTQNNSKYLEWIQKRKTCMNFWGPIFCHSNLIHSVLQARFFLGITQKKISSRKIEIKHP